MKLTVIKANGKTKCRHRLCAQNPIYFNKGRIKKGTTCAAISTDGASGWHTSYYCRDCIDKIYLDMKTILNPNLWAFQ